VREFQNGKNPAVSRGRKYRIFPKESQGLILQAAETCRISWVLSVQHLYKRCSGLCRVKALSYKVKQEH